jgi:hypothetical protein
MDLTGQLGLKDWVDSALGPVTLSALGPDMFFCVLQFVSLTNWPLDCSTAACEAA